MSIRRTGKAIAHISSGAFERSITSVKGNTTWNDRFYEYSKPFVSGTLGNFQMAGSTWLTNMLGSCERINSPIGYRSISPVKLCISLRWPPSAGFVCLTTKATVEAPVVGKPAIQKSHWKKKKKRGFRPSSKSAGSDLLPNKKAEISVVVVESPAKAKTIEKYLGENHVVLPSYGHVRDLTAKAGSVRPDEDFLMVWEVPASAQPHLNCIKAALEGASTLILASDPDREGEAIAWHILEMLQSEGALKSGTKVHRVVFHEITKTAVLQAMQVPRDISPTLVNAYLARRALDYLIGFDLSPVLWRKLPGSKSAGRVQSAALRLVCDRESEMEAFTPQEYWTVDVEMSVSHRGEEATNKDAQGSKNGELLLTAHVTHFQGEKLAQFSLSSEEQAQAVVNRVMESKFEVSSVRKSLLRRHAPPPYITSTLQQDASSKLDFGASRTMAVAQKLYEGVKLDNSELTGLITYMRTDSVQLSSEAVQSIRVFAAKRYGPQYVPAQPRMFISRAKNAQEAHEAVRPTDISRLPSTLTNVLDEDALRLYSLIWCRTIACQMEQAVYAQVAVDITNETEDVQMRSSGSSLLFPGFVAALKDTAPVVASKDESIREDQEELVDDGKLQSIEAGDTFTLSHVKPIQHLTEGPPRYSEGTLVKRLEELGIGRPSTYASTIKTLQSRSYVRLEKRRIFPEPRGRMVSAFLSHYFPNFADFNFTAKFEDQLDEVSAGRADWKDVLGDFWPDFHTGVLGVLKVPMDEVVELLEVTFGKLFFSSSKGQVCPRCGEGKMGLKLSRFGAGFFLGCCQYPKCLHKQNVLLDGDDGSSDDDEVKQGSQTRVLGMDPSSGLEVTLKTGPFGKYVQLGNGSKKQKPKRTALPKKASPDDIDLVEALKLLKYPFELGEHPETGTPILVCAGQFGLYIRHRGIFSSIPKTMSVDELTVDKALELLNSKNVSKRGRKPQTAKIPNVFEGKAVPELDLKPESPELLQEPKGTTKKETPDVQKKSRKQQSKKEEVDISKSTDSLVKGKEKVVKHPVKEIIGRDKPLDAQSNSQGHTDVSQEKKNSKISRAQGSIQLDTRKARGKPRKSNMPAPEEPEAPEKVAAK